MNKKETPDFFKTPRKGLSDGALKIIIKLNFLILGLVLTVYVVYSLNKKGLSPALKSMFGY